MFDPEAVPILKFERVSKSFKRKKILSDISLTVCSKEIVGIIGLSGSGKTTLLNLLIGFIKPTRGDVLFHAEHLVEYAKQEVFRSVFSRPKEVRKTFGFAAQYPSFYSDLTVIENLRYFGSLYNLNRDTIRSNAHSLIHLMDLEDAIHLKAGSLSGGMARRLDIACALIHDPKVLILDEPTSDLDSRLRKHIWHLLKKINEKGTTIILSSHHLEDLDFVCDRVAVIHNSKIVNVDTPENLKNNFTNNVEIHIETVSANYGPIIESVKNIVDDYKEQDHKLILYTPKVEKSLHQSLDTIISMNDILLDFNISKPSLIEVFESLTRKKINETENN